MTVGLNCLIELVLNFMLCCQDCNIQTESTFNTVIFNDQSYNQLQNKLQHYAEKHQKRMQMNKNHTKPTAAASNKENAISINLQNQPSSSFDLPTKRKLMTGRENMDRQYEQVSPNEQTGRVRKAIETPKNARNSHSKNLESKTTSFTSLASRNSESDFHRERELIVLKHQLDKLCKEENLLLRNKLEKEYLYKQQLLKINQKRDELKKHSTERQVDLAELKKLLLKHKKDQ